MKAMKVPVKAKSSRATFLCRPSSVAGTFFMGGKTMKGLIVYTLIHKNGSDCTNEGVTSKYDKFILVGEGVPELFEPSEDTPVLELKKKFYGREYIHASPITERYTMFGGNFVYSSDSRFPSDYPIPVHDRVEVT